MLKSVRLEMLFKTSAKSVARNVRTEMLSKRLSTKTVVQNVRAEMLAEKAPSKIIT